MIRNVLFDLDDTLFDFGKAEGIALTRALSSLDIPVTDELIARYGVINSECWGELERGILSLEEVKVERYARLFAERRIDVDPQKATAVYEHFLGIGHYYVDGAEESLRALHGKYRLYIASNGTASVQKGRLASAGIAPLFDDIFISEDIGYFKPDVKFFDYCFSKIPSFSKEETVLVGDRLSSDIRGGTNADIKTIWFNPSGAPNSTELTPSREIKSLRELEKTLESM